MPSSRRIRCPFLRPRLAIRRPFAPKKSIQGGPASHDRESESTPGRQGEFAGHRARRQVPHPAVRARRRPRRPRLLRRGRGQEARLSEPDRAADAADRARSGRRARRRRDAAHQVERGDAPARGDRDPVRPAHLRRRRPHDEGPVEVDHDARGQVRRARHLHDRAGVLRPAGEARLRAPAAHLGEAE